MPEHDYPGISKLLQSKRAAAAKDRDLLEAQQREAQIRLQQRRHQYRILRKHPVVRLFQEVGGLLLPHYEDISLGIINPDRLVREDIHTEMRVALSLVWDLKNWVEYDDIPYSRWNEANCAIYNSMGNDIHQLMFNIDPQNERRGFVAETSPAALKKALDRAVTHPLQRDSHIFRIYDPEGPAKNYRDIIPLQQHS